MKKLLALLLAVLMIFSLAACGNGETASDNQNAVSSNEDYPTIKFTTFTVYETIVGEGKENVEKMINDYIHEKGYKFNIEIEVITGADYMTQVNMNLASGSDIDIFLSMEYSTHVAQNSVIALDPYFENELAGAAALFDEEWLGAVKVNGQHYAIPAHTTAASTYYYVCREDLVNEMGYDVSKVTDLESLEEFFAAIKEAYPNMWCSDVIATNPMTLLMLEEGKEWGYFNMNYAVGMSAENEGVMENIYASDTFKKACEISARWMEKGYMNPAGSTDTTYSPDYINSEQAFGWIVGNANNAETQALNYSAISGKPLMAIPIANATDSNAGFIWCISHSCKYPSEAAQLLNLMYTDEFVLNAVCYGIEGTDYVWKDAINAYGYPEGTDRTTVPYSYAVGITVVGDRLKCHPFENYYSEADRVYIQDKIENTVRTPLYGLSLNAEPVKTQITAVSNVVDQYFDGLMFGELDYETVLPQFIADLEAAGVNDIIAEAQAQYDAWKKS